MIVLIPARGGSKRIPRKNLQEVGGVPLVVHAITVARSLFEKPEIVVSSDDSEILSLSKKFGAFAWRRGFAAATDDATDRDVIMDLMNGRGYNDDHLIVYLRPTTPFRTVGQVEWAINQMRDIPAATGLRSVHEMSESAYKVFRVKGPKLVPFGTRTIDQANYPNHKYPPTYQPNGIVDIMRASVVRGGDVFGSEVIAHITQPTIEIDTPFDLRMAQFQASCNKLSTMEVFHAE